MTGTIAQIIAIVSFGNAALSGQNVNFSAAHSTAQFCNKIEFALIQPSGDRSKEIVVAKNFLEWINYLRKRGVIYLRLQHTSTNNKDFNDRMTAGFIGGGGRWLIEAVHGGKVDIWEARWEVTDKDNKDKKIWSVTYGEIAQNYLPSRENHQSLGDVQAALKNALKEVLIFTKTQKVDKYWIDSFILALNCLESEDPLSKVYHKDLIPKDKLELKAQQIIAAAQAAYVFGGMGSWNDMGFKGSIQKEYERVSERLFLIINIAIVSAVNSYPSELKMTQAR